MTNLPQEVAALRDAVDDLANRVALNPAYRAPDRTWIQPVDHEKFAEWDVQNRYLTVRAGHPDGVPGVFLVNHWGDMHALSLKETHHLIEALSAGVQHLTNDLTARRERRSS